MQLDDFVIQIDAPGAEGHPVRVLASPAGEGVGTFLLPPGIAGLPAPLVRGTARDHAPQPAATDTPRDARRCELPPVPQTPIEIGTELFEGLFRGQVGQLFDRSLGGLKGEQQGLRLKVKIDPAEPSAARLQSLPWELLYRAETAQFLALSRRSPLVRYLDVPQPVRKLPLPKPLRVLAVTSGPADLPSLDLDRELRRIQGAARGARRVQVDVLEHATPGRLRSKLLADPIHVLHFMGHGGHDPATQEGVFYFEDEGGRASAVSGRALAVKLQDVRSLALVVLNACQTARTDPRSASAFSDVAGALVRGGMPAVVAMRQSISDGAAIAFSSSFYERLAVGDAVDLALTEGRQAIHSAAPDGYEWSIPILFARVPSGDLFLRPGPTRRGAWLLVGALTLAVVGGPWIYDDLIRGHVVLSVDQAFASNQDGVSGRIDSVEITADGRMRIFFTFVNDTREEKNVGLDFEKTYLADMTGRAYEVRSWSTPVEGAPRLVEAIPAGEERRHWIEVDVPQADTRRLGVALAGVERADVSFPYFEVDLPEVPARLASPATERALPDDSDAVAMDAQLATNVAGLEASVSQVAMVADRAMRWSLDVFNRAGRDVGLGLMPAGFELIDDLGNVYRPLAHGYWDHPGKFWDGIRLPNALKVGYWLDFPPPRPGATRFTLRPATAKQSEARLGVAELDLDAAVKRLLERYPALATRPTPATPKLRPKPPAPPAPAVEPEAAPDEEAPAELQERPVVTFQLRDGERELGSTLDGLRAKVAAIDRLGNGRMRWHLHFVNASGSTLAFGIDYGRSALSAGSLTYRLERSSTTADPTQRRVDSFALPPGGERQLWIEFAGQAESVDDLMVLTLASSAAESFRFRPLMVRLSEVRSSE